MTKKDQATVNRMMVPCYLSLEEYIMFKHLAERDMRTMSGMLKVLIYREAHEQGVSPEDFEKEAQELREKRQLMYEDS